MDVRDELRQVLAELELVSHVPALDYASKSENQGTVSTDRSPGGKRPRGGVDRKDDREREFTLKSADHFRRRAAAASSDRTLELILEDAKKTLAAWRRQPAPEKSNEPDYGTPQWKRYVAESGERANVLAKRFGVTRQYIEKVRREYEPPEPRIRRPEIVVREVGCSNCGTPDTAPHSDMCEACLEFAEARQAAGDPFDAEAA